MAVTESVKIVFEVDDKALVSTVAQLQAVGKVSQEDAAKFNALSAASKAAGASLDGASKGAKQFAEASKDAAKSTTEVANAAGDLKDVGSSLSQAGESATAAGEGFVSLKQRIKEAKDELERLQETTGGVGPEFDAAKKNVFDLQKQLGDLNKEVALTDPKNKAAAFQAFGQSVLGAFQVATGALQAFGIENEKAQEVAQRLQGALNIVEGIRSITQLKDTFQDLSKVLGFTTAAQNTLTVATNTGAASTGVASGAMRGFAAALASTGIGAIVVALGALAGAFLLSSGNADKETEATKRLKSANDDLVKAKQQNYIKSLEIAALTDPSKKALLDLVKLEAETGEKKLAAQKNYAEKQAAADRIAANNRFMTAEGLYTYFVTSEEDVIEARKEAQLAKELLNEAEKSADLELIKFNAEQAQSQKDKAKEDANKRIQDQKDENAKQKQLSEERKQARIKAIQDEIAALEEAQRGALIGVEDELQRIAIVDSFRSKIQEKQIEKARLTVDSLKLLDEKYANDSKQIFEDLFTYIESLRDKDVENADKSAADKLKADEKFLDDRKALLNQEQELELLRNEIDVANIANKEERERALAEKNFRTQEKYIKKRIELEEQATIEQNKLLGQLDEARENQVITAEEYEKKRTEILLKGGQDQEKLLAQLALLYKNYEDGKTDQTNSNEQKRLDKIKESTDAIIQLVGATSEIFIEANQRRYDEEIANLEDAREQGVITEEQYEARVKKVKQKAAEDQKKAQLFQATMSAAQAILNALTVQPATAVPAALTLASLLSAINIAKILATPIPKFKKGTLAVPGTDTGDDSVMAMLRPGEAVIPTEMNREYAKTIKAIYTRKVSSKELNEFVESRSRMTVVKDEPVFNFNPVTLDALFKRDIRVSQMSSSLQRSTGGTMPTINVKADVDTYALSKAMAKNKTMEIGNPEQVAKALAAELSKTNNLRRQ